MSNTQGLAQEERPAANLADLDGDVRELSTADAVNVRGGLLSVVPSTDPISLKANVKA